MPESCESVGGAAPVTIKGSTALPSGPDDARDAVGARSFARHRPLLQVVERVAAALLAVRGQQRRSSTKERQRAQINVTALGDVPPRRPRSPLEHSRGVSPSQEEKRRAQSKRWMFPTVARSAVLVSRPMTGISRS
jgi:hypothetical protein